MARTIEHLMSEGSSPDINIGLKDVRKHPTNPLSLIQSGDKVNPSENRPQEEIKWVKVSPKTVNQLTEEARSAGWEQGTFYKAPDFKFKDRLNEDEYRKQHVEVDDKRYVLYTDKDNQAKLIMPEMAGGATGIAVELRDGLDENGLRAEIEKKLRTAEDEDTFEGTFEDFEDKLRQYELAINNYNGNISEETKKDLVAKVRSRALLLYGSWALENAGYENYANAMNKYFTGRNLYEIWYETMGSNRNVIQELSTIIEQGNHGGGAQDAGLYWIESPVSRNPKTGELGYAPGSRRAAAKAMLDNVFSNSPDRESDARTAISIAEKLAIITLKAQQYAGPRDSANNLYALKFKADSGGQAKYFESRVYWDKWRQQIRDEIRNRNQNPNYKPLPNVPLVIDMPRRLLHAPEYFLTQDVAAKSLLPGAQTYLVPLPDMEEMSSLVAYMNSKVFLPEVGGGVGNVFAFVQAVKGASEEFESIRTWLRNPVIYNAREDERGYPARTAKMIAPLVELAKKGSFLIRVNSDLLYFTTAWRIADTINFINNYSEDRRNKFTEWSAGFKNLHIGADEARDIVLNNEFNSVIGSDPKYRELARRLSGATERQVVAREAAKIGGGAALGGLRALLKVLLK